MIESEHPGSHDAPLRYEAILQLARQAARRRRRMRYLRGGAGACMILIACGVTAYHLIRSQPVAAPNLAHATTHSRTSPDLAVTPKLDQRGVMIVQIITDSTISQRLSIKPQPQKWRVIGDDELLEKLAEAGHPAGLARVDGRIILLPR